MADQGHARSSKPVTVAAPRKSTNGSSKGSGGGLPRPPPMVPDRVRRPTSPVPRPPPLARRKAPAEVRLGRPKQVMQQMNPPPRGRRSGRGWCCTCCIWLTLMLLGLVFLGAIALGVVYIVYHPQLPTFALSSLRLAALNVSDSYYLTSRINFTVTARNTNEKIAFLYGDIAAAFWANGTDIGDGTVPGFVHPAGNTTVIEGSASAAAVLVDPVVADSLRSSKSHDMLVEMDFKVGFQVGRFKSKRINVRVLCAGFTAGIAKTPTPSEVPIADAPVPVRSKISLFSSSSGGGGATSTERKCKIGVKIWIWSFL